jgi:hypothetical protein
LLNSWSQSLTFKKQYSEELIDSKYNEFF